MRCTVKAAAKINLMLDIIRKRTDNYHDLFMIMQSVSVYDNVTVKMTDDKKITLTCSDITLPTDEKNIAYKAALAFFEDTKAENTGINIYIEKNIPHAAGLAGGSADGAAVIVALNKLFKTKLSKDELCKIGVKIGADVPFCIKGGTLLAQGIGDVLSKVKPLEKCYIVLAKPEYGVNTGKAYNAFDSNDGYCRQGDRLGMLTALQNNDLDKTCSLLSNMFEQFIEVPDRVEIKRIMTYHGAKGTCMSGSGPTVFGIFYDEIAAQKCKNELKTFVKDVLVCTPADKGCEFE